MGALPNLDPVRLAHMALNGASARKWVLSNLRYVARHQRQDARIIELTGAHICLLGGPSALRHIAESAESDDGDRYGQVVSLLLMSGYWRTDEIRAATQPA